MSAETVYNLRINAFIGSCAVVASATDTLLAEILVGGLMFMTAVLCGVVEGRRRANARRAERTRR